MRPLVSILIPAYNAEKWLGAAIASAVGQTWRHKEIIIVDDGSTDGTPAVARQFESNDVRIVTQPNQGAAAAMWTKEARIQHAPREERYPSDVTDAEWRSFRPSRRRGGVGGIARPTCGMS